MSRELKPLVYGSVRAEITPENKTLFCKDGTTKELEVIPGNGDSFMLNPACLTELLKTYIERLDPLVDWRHGDRTELKLLTAIAGIDLIAIEKEDKNSVRIKFSGRTQSQFEGKMDKIVAWLDKNNIIHGEKDGSKVCIFKCITNPDKELSDFFRE